MATAPHRAPMTVKQTVAKTQIAKYGSGVTCVIRIALFTVIALIRQRVPYPRRDPFAAAAAKKIVLPT
jgi:hypothetical protein